MRIAYITDETFPNRSASGLQIVQTLSALSAAGADVDMVFPVRLRDKRSVAELRQAFEAYFHVACGFGLKPLRTHVSRRRVPIKVAHGIAATAFAIRHKYDLVYTRTITPILPTLAAGGRVLFETYRPLTQQYPASRIPFVKVAQRRGFMGIVTHSKLARDAFIGDGLPADRVETVYNGFDPEAFAEQRTPAQARTALGLPERPTVVYTGRISHLKNIDLLLDAAERVPEAQWVFAGANDTEEAQPYVDRIRGMDHVRTTGYLTGPELVKVLQAGDVLVIPPSADPLTRFGTTVLPIKLFTYLAAGRAIVAGDLPDTGELLRHEHSALLVKPDDVGALAEAVARLIQTPRMRKLLADGARQLSQRFDWESIARRTLEAYGACVHD